MNELLRSLLLKTKYLFVKLWDFLTKIIFRMLLKKLLEEINNEKFSHHQMSLAGVTRDLVEYNVSTQPVSLHLPLVRLVNFHLIHLEKASKY